MRRLVGVAIVGILAWQVYLHYQRGMRTAVAEPAAAVAVQFNCDGRTYCSQMTSCEEATFFLRNCPGVRMDGNNDGVPCEKQWCRR